MSKDEHPELFFLYIYIYKLKHVCLASVDRRFASIAHVNEARMSKRIAKRSRPGGRSYCGQWENGRQHGVGVFVDNRSRREANNTK